MCTYQSLYHSYQSFLIPTCAYIPEFSYLSYQSFLISTCLFTSVFWYLRVYIYQSFLRLNLLLASEFSDNYMCVQTSFFEPLPFASEFSDAYMLLMILLPEFSFCILVHRLLLSYSCSGNMKTVVKNIEHCQITQFQNRMYTIEHFRLDFCNRSYPSYYFSTKCVISAIAVCWICFAVKYIWNSLCCTDSSFRITSFKTLNPFWPKV